MTDFIQSNRFEENRLVRQVQAGNAEAFAELYEVYVKRIYDFIYHKTFQGETSRDLTQTVFLKAIEHINKLDLEAGSFSSWLFAIARNSVIDHFRTHHPSSPLEDVWDLAADNDVQIDEQNRERYEILHGYLHRLSAEKRELLILRIWQDLSFAEIADMQGVSLGSCKMAFHRLIKQMQKEMPALLLLLLIMKP